MIIVNDLVDIMQKQKIEIWNIVATLIINDIDDELQYQT